MIPFFGYRGLFSVHFNVLMDSSSGTWTKRLSPQVADAVIRNGRVYHQSGRVDIDVGTNKRVEATVHGTQSYQVGIDVRGKDIQASCTCGFFRKGEICKHIWATFLEAERTGALQSIAYIDHPYIDVDFMDFLADDVAAFRRPAPPPTPAKKEPWRHHFEMLRGLK